MALYKLHEFDPDYRDTFGGEDIKGLDVYTEGTDEKIGTVSDALVDDDGRFRYLIVDTGFWIFGKKVLLPIGRSRIDYNGNRAYASMTKEQVENLQNVNDLEKIDYEQEEQARGVYRPMAANSTSYMADDTSSYAANEAMTGASMTGASTTGVPAYDRNTYDYDYDANLYNMRHNDHQTLRLYEERLIANKKRVKTGEVAVGKHVETESSRVSVPVEKERVVIERSTPTDARAVTPGDQAFREGEVAHVEVYEETPDIHKEAFVREEVNVRKVSEQETVTAEERLRRETLDVDSEGNPSVQDRR